MDAAVDAGADAVGFVMYDKSPRFISPERAAELARRLPPFVTPVLLFVNAPAPQVLAACERVPGLPSSSMATRRPQQCLEAAAGGRALPARRPHPPG